MFTKNDLHSQDKNEDTSKHSPRDRCGLALTRLGLILDFQVLHPKLHVKNVLVVTNPNPTPSQDRYIPQPIYKSWVEPIQLLKIQP